ncbi:MAG: hypothetical protein IAE95_04480 [Chitinophagaceae bacterium]|nr:hypothetical protein [Chitinophagaceae bacterium]
MNESISHDKLYMRLSEVLEKLDLVCVTDAFLYSLSTRDLQYRAHLACYIFAKSIPPHKIITEVYPSGNIACSYCGHCSTCPQDTVQIGSELVRWGGVRFQDVFTATYYLDMFSKMDRVYPAKADFDIFNNMVDVIVSSEDDFRPRDLEKIFAGIFRSNKGEREMIINQLGVMGILQTETNKGFETVYTPPGLREIPSVGKIDWHYPVCWWRGQNGIDRKAYQAIFGRYVALRRSDL